MGNKSNPRLSRPHTAASYGLKGLDEGLLIPWAEVAAKLAAARNYWASTTSPDGRPHTTPIWGIWWQEQFYFGADPLSRKGKNLALQPAISIHLESGDDVVIIEGEVRIEGSRPILAKLWHVYGGKYDLPEPEEPVPLYALRPKKAFAWLESSYPQTATRYQFED
jgi:hypothetical protein